VYLDIVTSQSLCNLRMLKHIRTLDRQLAERLPDLLCDALLDALTSGLIIGLRDRESAEFDHGGEHQVRREHLAEDV
jgi:hypothetical protein